MNPHENNVPQIHKLPGPLHTSKDTKTKRQPFEIICIPGQKRKKSIFSWSLSHLPKHTLLLYMILTKKYTAQEITGHRLNRVCKYSLPALKKKKSKDSRNQLWKFSKSYVQVLSFQALLPEGKIISLYYYKVISYSCSKLTVAGH